LLYPLYTVLNYRSMRFVLVKGFQKEQIIKYISTKSNKKDL